MDAGTVSVLIALVGCFVGLAGWLSGRDKKIQNDSEWKGTVNAKLDSILSASGAQSERLDKLENDFSELSEDIAALEQSVKSAHHRLDKLEVN